MTSWEMVAPGVWKLRLGTPEAITPIALKRTAPRPDPTLPEVEAPRWSPDAVGFRRSERGVLVALPLGGDESIYGFGLQLASFRQNNRKKTVRVNSDPQGDLGDSHAPAPFYVSSAGYAVFVDTARYVSFYCGSHTEGPRAIGVTTEELYSASGSGDSTMVIDIPYAAGGDIYYFAGPEMKDALRRYVLFSGGGAMPPEWGLGVFYRGFGPNDGEATRKLARELRDTGMPCDVLGLEPGWQSQSYSNSLRWDAGRFPDHDALVAELRGMGFRINLWEQLFVHPASPIHDALAPYSGDIRVWQGLVPDLTLEPARRIFGDDQRENFVLRGIDGFKVDECDHSDFIRTAWSFPEYTRFPGGMEGDRMHCSIGVLAQQVLDGEFRRTGRRTWSNIRASHGLAAAYPFVLYSDLYDHRDFVRGVATAALSGLLWTPEVRQCDSADELLRRLQAVIFSPMALINGWMIKHAPWLQFDVEKNKQDELLDDGGALAAQCRKLLELRMSLIPYLYAAFGRYHFHGVPVFRPPVLEYPDRPAALDIDDAWFVGDDLYFAPVIAGTTSRRVWLPPGTWCDFFSGVRYAGDKEYEFTPAADELLLFAREGALVPWARPCRNIGDNHVHEIELLAFGDGSGAVCRLLADDGVGWDFETKPDSWIEITVGAAGQPEWRCGAAARRDRYQVTKVKTL